MTLLSLLVYLPCLSALTLLESKLVSRPNCGPSLSHIYPTYYLLFIHSCIHSFIRRHSISRLGSPKVTHTGSLDQLHLSSTWVFAHALPYFSLDPWHPSLPPLSIFLVDSLLCLQLPQEVRVEPSRRAQNGYLGGIKLPSRGSPALF